MRKILHITIILFILILSSIHSQQMNELFVTGEPTFLPNEIVGNERIDANGNRCAGLIISTDLAGLTFDSNNGIVDVKYSPGKYFLYLSPEERVVEVFKEGFKSLRILLSDLSIKLGSGKVWEIEITGEKLIPVNILTSPEKAEITINGVDKGEVSKIMLSAGNHSIILRKENYKEIVDSIFVSTENTLFTFTLEKVDVQGVQILSTPTGANIFINNDEIGTTNKGIFLYPGDYNLRLFKPGFTEINTVIAVKEGEHNVFDYQLESNTGILLLTIEPSDAKIFVDQQEFYTNRIDVLPGNHLIQVTKSGYAPHEEIINILRGETIQKSIILAPKTGTLRFTVQPLQARVELKQHEIVKYSWIGIKLLKDIPVGQYKLICKMEGYKTEIIDINIEENKTNITDTNLKTQNTLINDGISNVDDTNHIPSAVESPQLLLAFGGLLSFINGTPYSHLTPRENHRFSLGYLGTIEYLFTKFFSINLCYKYSSWDKSTTVSQLRKILLEYYSIGSKFYLEENGFLSFSIGRGIWKGTLQQNIWEDVDVWRTEESVFSDANKNSTLYTLGVGINIKIINNIKLSLHLNYSFSNFKPKIKFEDGSYEVLEKSGENRIELITLLEFGVL